MVPYTRPWIAGLVSLVLLFALSCSGGGGSPIAPPSTGGDADLGLTSGTGSGDSTGSQGPSAQAYAGQSAGLWGIYDIVYDPGVGDFVVTPVRSANFAFNALTFLQPPNGNPANLGIKVIDKTHILDEGRLTINVSITHPLSMPRLVGFDTYGVVIGNGSLEFSEDEGVVFAGPEDLLLENFDGYTRWMNPVEFTDPGLGGFTEGLMGTKDVDWTATVNAYKYFAEGLGPQDDLGEYLNDEDMQEFRGAFLPDTTNTREYQLKFPMVGGFPQLKFQYAVISHFMGARDGNGDPIPEPEISDFPISANAHEAVYIAADAGGSTLYYNETSGVSGGDLYLQLTIFDWQGMEAFGGEGAFEEINAIAIDSPDGLFGTGGLTLEATDLIGTETSSGPNSTTLQLLVEDVQAPTWGPHEVFIAVYNQEPNTYGPNLGCAYPEDAILGGYTRTIVEVEKKTSADNHPPVIEEIQGPTETSCWDTESVYTCIASDEDPEDRLQYQWAVVWLGTIPIYENPPTEDNTATIDWSNERMFPPGIYEVCFKVTDGQADDEMHLDVEKVAGGLKMEDITADDEDTYDVECSNTDAVYTTDAESCDPDADILFRWLRGPGEPPEEIDPDDPGWSEYFENNSIVYSWDGTVIGDWWIVAQANDGISTPALSSFYLVYRIDTPPTDINPPSGATEVDCNSNHEVYTLTGGEDCDGNPNERQWTITQTDVPPAGGWVGAVDDQFVVDWSVYPIGTYYAWQRIGGGDTWTVSDPLEIHRVNTGPDIPNMPEGPQLVDCTFTDALYQAGVVGDCEGDPVTRQWALGLDVTPPETGWVGFEGTTFTIDYSKVATAEYFLYQRASDNDVDWNYSDGLTVVKVNAPPDRPPTPAGKESVTCYDDAEVYDAGEATDCDYGDVLTRRYMVSVNPDIPFGEWVEFTGTSFVIDWSAFESRLWYIFQQVSDGEVEMNSDALPVIKGNSPPEVGTPSGPTDVDCTSTEVEYTEGTIFDCDPGTEFFKQYYLSVDPDTPFGGFWTPYEGESFFLDFSMLPSGDYYLFVAVSDGMDEGQCETPLHIVRHNSAPDKPPVLDGPVEVDCGTNPAMYDAGPATDCDPFDVLTRYYYISTDPLVPTGGDWVEFFGDRPLVDFTGVVAEDPYYLFQKVSDGELETASDSLGVVYHNTPPMEPMMPLGEVNVSCANDNEPYEGGEIMDCDSWQTHTRSWAINDIDNPPSIGWTQFTGTSWTVDWSLYAEGTYYMFQRANDGYGYVYSRGLQIIVGPPQLVPLDPPVGPEDLMCNGSIETYDAGEYMPGCPGAGIIREWAHNVFPSPPLSGWVEFSGTTFDVDPTTLGFGYVYLFQRARLDDQTEYSNALTVEIHPAELGDPPIPSGPTTVDCDSRSEEYEMGSVYTESPGTPVDRFWQVQNTSGEPQNDWQLFTESPVIIDWTIFQTGGTYHLVQMADDGDHQTYSEPLVVTYVNDEPEFLGTLTGPTDVTCLDIMAPYDGGEVYDCDNDQTLIREWAWSYEDVYPVVGWEEMFGQTFFVDYSDPDIQPGDIYLFQRVTDGIVYVYDASLHVTYTNSPPDQPNPPEGPGIITCENLQVTYNCGEATDCDGSPLTREAALSADPTPPSTGWSEFAGDSFDFDWSGVDFGIWYLWQRVSDPEYTVTSDYLRVWKVNSPPDILSFECDEGLGPFDTDGDTTGLTGLDLIDELNFSYEVDDCDGDSVDVYYAVTDSDIAPSDGDPAWIGPLSGGMFMVDFSAYTDLAPSALYIHLGADDGTNVWTTQLWGGSVNMWDRIWLTAFTDPGDMWTEDPCVSGTGSYTWGHDAGNGYLRLLDYGEESQSAVWGSSIAMPSAPDPGDTAALMSHMNPALNDAGLDNVYFAFLDDVSCDDYVLDIVNGSGCEFEGPELMEFSVPQIAPIWGHDRRIGIYQSGFDGCDPCNFYLDWVGFWIKPH